MLESVLILVNVAVAIIGGLLVTAGLQADAALRRGVVVDRLGVAFDLLAAAPPPREPARPASTRPSALLGQSTGVPHSPVPQNGTWRGGRDR